MNADTIESRVLFVNQILQQLYNPITTVQDKKSAESQLLAIQRQPEACIIAAQLLDLPDPNAKFFGAQTLYTLLNSDQSTQKMVLEQLWIKEKLTHILLNPTHSMPLFVLRKVAQTLISMTLRGSDPVVGKFIESLISEMRQRILQNTSSPDIVKIHIQTALECLIIIPEECTVWNDNLDNKSNTFSIVSSSENVLNFLSEFLHVPDTSLQKLSLSCLSSWVQHRAVKIDVLPEIVRVVLNKLGDPQMTESAAEVMVELLSDSRVLRFENTLIDNVLMTVTSSPIRDALYQAISDEDHEYIKSIAKLMSEFGQNFIPFLIKNSAQAQVQTFLEMMYRCTTVPGTFGIDEEVSDISLYFWYLLEEGFHEHDEGNASRSVSMSIFSTLLKGLVQKSAFPAFDLWTSTPKDVKEKFLGYRKECGETMLFCYYTLQSSAVRLISEMLQECLSNDSPDNVEKLESLLFAFRSFHESIDSEENEYLPNLFNDYFLQRLSQVVQSGRDPGHRIEIIVSALIASYSEWLNKHPNALPVCLKFVLSCLPIRETETSAVAAFYALCDTCRNSLTSYVDEIVNVCAPLLPRITKSSKSTLIQGISLLIAAMSPSDAKPRIYVLINGLLRDLEAHLKQYQLPETKVDIEDDLSAIKSFFKGIRPIEVIDIETRAQTILPASTSSLTQEELHLGTTFISLMGHVLQIFASDAELVMLASETLREAWKSESEIITARLDGICGILLDACQRQGPQVTFIKTIEVIIQTCGADQTAAPMQWIVETVKGVIHCMAQRAQQRPNTIDDDPELFQTFQEFMIVTLRYPTLLEAIGAESLLYVYDTWMIAGFASSERWTLLSCLEFWKSLIVNGHSDSPLSSFVGFVLNHHGFKVILSILKCIHSKAPPSVLSHVAETFYEFVTHFPEYTRTWSLEAIQDASFTSSSVTMEHHQQFIQTALGLRQFKKFKELVKSHAMKCRGLSNTAFEQIFDIIRTCTERIDDLLQKSSKGKITI